MSKKAIFILSSIISLMLLIALFQIYIWLRLSIINDYSDFFYYSMLLISVILIFWGYYKRLTFFLILGTVILLLFTPINFCFKYVENYYLEKAIISSKKLTQDLNKYREINNEFPENLSMIYKDNKLPNYRIGLFSYDFGYVKKDSTHRLYFNLFDGRIFCKYSSSESWTICD